MTFFHSEWSGFLALFLPLSSFWVDLVTLPIVLIQASITLSTSVLLAVLVHGIVTIILGVWMLQVVVDLLWWLLAKTGAHGPQSILCLRRSRILTRAIKPGSVRLLNLWQAKDTMLGKSRYSLVPFDFCELTCITELATTFSLIQHTLPLIVTANTRWWSGLVIRLLTLLSLTTTTQMAQCLGHGMWILEANRGMFTCISKLYFSRISEINPLTHIYSWPTGDLIMS